MRPKPVPAKYQDFPRPFGPYRPKAAFVYRMWVVVICLTALGALGAIGLDAEFPFYLFIPLFGMVFYVKWNSRHWRRRAIRHDWLLCLGCGYLLNRLEVEGCCSECGKPYTHASTQWGWRVHCNEWTSDMDPPPPLPVQK